MGEEDLYQTEAFRQGQFELQDLHSQAVGHLCGPRSGETWWDACAGAGGKTLHLSDLMANKGLIWASDRSHRRLQELRRRCARAGAFNLRWAHWPREDHLPTRTRFDGVLLDAPCAGLGTWDRNPDARWTTRREDVIELGRVQARLLERVSSQVKPGGRLIYAVCSLARNETEDVAARFEELNAAFKPLAWENREWRGEKTDPPGRCWFWPRRSGSVGMFVAGWRRDSGSG